MTQKRFAAPPVELLIARPLDGLVALYHRPSGQTHVVASPAPEIIEALQSGGSMTAGELLVALGLNEGGELLAARLSELLAAGLIEAQ